jgi:hypothetical protein
MDKMKIEVKLPIYDGTPGICADWFFTLEKNLTHMKIDNHLQFSLVVDKYISPNM